MFTARQGYLKGIRNATSYFNPGTQATLSSTEVKIGPTSANFVGGNINSAIYTADSNRFVMGTNPFTIEFWFNQTNTTSTFPSIISNDWNTRGSFAANDWLIQTHRGIGGQERRVTFWNGTFSNSGPLLTTSAAITLGTWNHVAVVRTAGGGAVMGTSTITAGTGVLTVGTLTSGTITVGLTLTGTGVPAGTYIVSNISGAGAGSTWNTNTTTGVSSTTITGNNFNLYLNGTSEARANNGNILDGTATTKRLCVGTFGTSTISTYRGYIDEFRFSNVARYFTNFTAPTTPFLDDTSTLCLNHFDGAAGTQSWPDDNT